jgi:hypothetical protein
LKEVDVRAMIDGVAQKIARGQVNEQGQPVPVWEVMQRGARLHRLREAGVAEPQRFIRSDREMRRALLIRSEQTGRPVQRSVYGKTCSWCGAQIRYGELACPEHLRAEEDLIEAMREAMDW